MKPGVPAEDGTAGQRDPTPGDRQRERVVETPAADVGRGRPVHRPAARAAANAQRRNIREILELEHEDLKDRSMFDRAADLVSRLASGPLFIFVHLVWFAGWIVANEAGRFSFDPPPFNLLMLIVSLEAIILTGFVLRAQSRMSMIADRRAQLDLQINLLAEQELTAMLRVLCAIGEKSGVDVANADPRVEQFRSQTDVRAIAADLEREKAVAEAAPPHRTGGESS